MAQYSFQIEAAGRQFETREAVADVIASFVGGKKRLYLPEAKDEFEIFGGDVVTVFSEVGWKKDDLPICLFRNTSSLRIEREDGIELTIKARADGTLEVQVLVPEGRKLRTKGSGDLNWEALDWLNTFFDGEEIVAATRNGF